MTNRIHIICHDQAGGGLGRKKLNTVINILNNYRIDYIIHHTNYASHAEVITERITNAHHYRKVNHILVIGGDGTLHKVVNTLIKNNKEIPVTYIAGGTGNDFHKARLKGKSIEDIIQQMIFDREPTYIPVFNCYNHHTKQNEIILNNMGYGFDAIVNHQVTKRKQSSMSNIANKLKLSYLSAVFSSLLKIPSINIKGDMDGIPFHYENVHIASIVNSPYAGGGIMIDNKAHYETNEISLIAYHNVKTKNVIPVLYKTLITHNQDTSEHVSRLTGRKLNLIITDPIIGHVDGEVIPESPVHITVTLTEFPFNI